MRVQLTVESLAGNQLLQRQKVLFRRDTENARRSERRADAVITRTVRGERTAQGNSPIRGAEKAVPEYTDRKRHQ